MPSSYDTNALAGFDEEFNAAQRASTPAEREAARNLATPVETGRLQARANRFADPEVDSRFGRRFDPTRTGGRRALDLSEGTVNRMSKTDWAARADEAYNRMYRPPWTQDPQLTLPQHQRTATSAPNFDWFDRADPFERYEITRNAYDRAGVKPGDPGAFDKMKPLRDEMLAVDPRSDAEMQVKGDLMRGRIEQRQEFKRDMQTLMDNARRPAASGSLAEMAAESPAMGTLRGIGEFGGKVMERAALPLLATGALIAGGTAYSEGQSPGQVARRVINEVFPVDSIISANRATLATMAKKGFSVPMQSDDNSL